MQSIKEQYRTVQDIVLTSLRDAILDGNLKPGHHLTVNTIASTLGVSAMPIRQALPVLEAEGFVKREPHRGYVVTELTASDIEEIYLMRIELEKLALRLGAQSRTRDDVQALRALHAQIVAALSAGEAAKYVSLSDQFRAMLCSICRRPLLIQVISDLRMRSQRFAAMYRRERGPFALHEEARAGLKETEAVIAALERGDATVAERHIEEGHRRAMTLLIEHLNGKG